MPSRFSALQRAENSSTRRSPREDAREDEFQCSSASRKFLNQQKFPDARQHIEVSVLFSEPKIPQFGIMVSISFGGVQFQCSSASRKFLNFVALRMACVHAAVSVLFSEPKIPQRFLRAAPRPAGPVVSVLFSEPKIPQCEERADKRHRLSGFSALQRAENSSIMWWKIDPIPHQERFSALQRAENSSIPARKRYRITLSRFQCSSASRKFLNRTSHIDTVHPLPVSVLFSEPKIPQFQTSPT